MRRDIAHTFRAASVAGLAIGLGAVLGEMTGPRAVVALGALDALTREMPYTTARIAVDERDEVRMKFNKVKQMRAYQVF